MAFYQVVASDIDGTLTYAGELSVDALRAIDRVRSSGVSVVLVSGRISTELDAEFPTIAEHADAMVLENGAVLVLDGEKFVLTDPVDSALDIELTSRGVPFRRGDALIATDSRYATAVVDAIGHLGMGYSSSTPRGITPS